MLAGGAAFVTPSAVEPPLLGGLAARTAKLTPVPLALVVPAGAVESPSSPLCSWFSTVLSLLAIVVEVEAAG